MQTKKSILLKGYIRPKRDYFLAVCLDLNLVGQGKTTTEALDSLKEALECYFEEINQNPGLYKNPLRRKAPRSFYFDYCRAYIICKFKKIFKKTTQFPPQNKNEFLDDEWCIEKLPINPTVTFQLA